MAVDKSQIENQVINTTSQSETGTTASTDTTTDDTTIAPFRPLFNYSSSQQGVSERFLHGASLDVIQVLPSFCDEDLPLREKAMAFLVPYGYSTTATTAQTTNETFIPTNTAANALLTQIGNYTLGSNDATKVVTTPGGISPWDYSGTATTKINFQRSSAVSVTESEVTADLAQDAATEIAKLNFNAIEFGFPVVDNSASAPPVNIGLAPLASNVNTAPVTNTNPQTATGSPIVTVPFNTDNQNQLGINLAQPLFNLPNETTAANSSGVAANETSSAVSSIPAFTVTQLPSVIPQSLDISDSPCGNYDFGALVFLINPETIDIALSAEYGTAATWGDIAQGQATQWLRNTNPVLNLNDVQVPGFSFRRVVQPIIDEAFNLLLMPGDNGVDPRVWSFVWGERRFEPCVVDSVRVKETGWYKGRTVIATISLVLRKVPDWQVNDGLDVIVYNPNLPNIPSTAATEANSQQSELQDAVTASDSNTSTTSGTNAPGTVSDPTIADAVCRQPYKCTTAQDYIDIVSKSGRQSVISTSDANLNNFITLCTNTATNIPGDVITSPDECSWDSCCRAYELLIQQEQFDAQQSAEDALCLNFDITNWDVESVTDALLNQVAVFLDINPDELQANPTLAITNKVEQESQSIDSFFSYFTQGLTNDINEAQLGFFRTYMLSPALFTAANVPTGYQQVKSTGKSVETQFVNTLTRTLEGEINGIANNFREELVGENGVVTVATTGTSSFQAVLDAGVIQQVLVNQLDNNFYVPIARQIARVTTELLARDESTRNKYLCG